MSIIVRDALIVLSVYAGSVLPIPAIASDWQMVCSFREHLTNPLADEFDAQHPATSPNHFAGLALLIFRSKREFEVGWNNG
jgi:hypothetical protein